MSPKSIFKHRRTGSTSQPTPDPEPEPQHILPTSFDSCFDEPGNPNQLEHFEYFKSFPIRDERVVDFEFMVNLSFGFPYLNLLRRWKFALFCNSTLFFILL